MTDQKQKLDAYLKQLEFALSPLPVAERSDILLELHTHISESLTKSGRTLEDILASLGSPASVAQGYLEQRGKEPNSSIPTFSSQSTSPQNTYAPPRQNSGCFKWGCISCLIALCILGLLLYLFFSAAWKVATSITSSASQNAQLQNGIVDVDGDQEKVSLLGGWLQVDGKNETVKIGNFLDVDGKNETVKIGDQIEVDGNKERMISRRQGNHKDVFIDKATLINKFGGSRKILLSDEFETSAGGLKISTSDAMSLIAYLDFKKKDILLTFEGEMLNGDNMPTLESLPDKTTWTYIHNEEVMTLELNFQEMNTEVNLNFGTNP